MTQTKNELWTILWVATFSLIQVGVTYADSYQGVQNACGQNLISVNGRYYKSCPNGYIDENNLCVPYAMPQCPPNYVLANGFCYLENQLPKQLCPKGYYLANNLCYPTVPLPCPYDTTTPAYETTIAPTTEPEHIAITPELPLPGPVPEPEFEPASVTRCPPGSIFTQDRCRKIICPQGEYYEGSCLSAACPEGTVWRGRQCQAPAYVTTVLEIENVFLNEAHYKPGHVIPVNENNVVYYTPKPPTMPNVADDDCGDEKASAKDPPSDALTATTTAAPPSRTTTTTTTTLRTTFAPTVNVNGTNCCSIVTPRICKNYGKKWVCFNRRYKRCDPKICTHPLIYLKTPKIVYEPPLLIMPPNPPLEACITPNCDGSDVVDCSGCAHNRRETCSTYCYRYMCPQGACHFIDLQEYCSYSPGEFGCTKTDGCIWGWCGEKCN